MSRSEIPLTAGERAALRSFRRAALTSRGYRAHLERLGVDHRTVSRLSQVPFTDKRSVFGDHIDFWVDGGSVSEAAELLTSSGSTGLFSVGVTSRSERRAQERTFDLTLRSLGGGEDSSTLLLNCLPMGISIPTRLATVATPSVHLEMAVELLARAGASFDRVIIAAEPVFLKELAETALRERGPDFGSQRRRLLRGRRVGRRELAPLRVGAVRLPRRRPRAPRADGLDGRRRGRPARAPRDARPARRPPGARQPARAALALRPRPRATRRRCSPGTPTASSWRSASTTTAPGPS